MTFRFSCHQRWFSESLLQEAVTPRKGFIPRFKISDNALALLLHAVFLSTTLSLLTFMPQANSCQNMIVSGANSWIPISYTNKANSLPGGIAHDVLKKISQDLNITLEYIPDLPWKRLMNSLKKGDIDIVAGAYWTVQRDEDFIFTKAFTVDEVRIFVMKGHEFTFNTLQDLKHKNGLAMLGISYGAAFSNYRSQLTLQETKTHKQLWQMLNAGRGEYLISPVIVGRATAEQLGLSEKFTSLNKSISQNNVHFLLSKKSKCRPLLNKINHLIQQYKADGTTNQIIETYIRHSK